jgi:hypothetical protein
MLRMLGLLHSSGVEKADVLSLQCWGDPQGCANTNVHEPFIVNKYAKRIRWMDQSSKSRVVSVRFIVFTINFLPLA